jgi:hypothetical protein
MQTANKNLEASDKPRLSLAFATKGSLKNKEKHMSDTDKIVESEKRVEEKTEELIYEFHAHYQSYIEQQHSTLNFGAGRKIQQSY